jgi:hypothetical protein
LEFFRRCYCLGSVFAERERHISLISKKASDCFADHWLVINQKDTVAVNRSSNGLLYTYCYRWRMSVIWLL